MYILKKVLRIIDRYEKETVEAIEGIISSRPEFTDYMEYLKGPGIHEGYAGIMTLEHFYSPEDIRVLKLSTSAGTELFNFAGGAVK